MADTNAPVAEGQRQAGRRAKSQSITPYTGKDNLPRPDFYDEKGRPRTGDKDGESVPFKPEKHYAVENETLVAYSIGRGGVHKRSLSNLRVSARDKRVKSEKFNRVTALREKLRKAGVPGA